MYMFSRRSVSFGPSTRATLAPGCAASKSRAMRLQTGSSLARTRKEMRAGGGAGASPASAGRASAARTKASAPRRRSSRPCPAGVSFSRRWAAGGCLRRGARPSVPRGVSFSRRWAVPLSLPGGLSKGSISAIESVNQISLRSRLRITPLAAALLPGAQGGFCALHASRTQDRGGVCAPARRGGSPLRIPRGSNPVRVPHSRPAAGRFADVDRRRPRARHRPHGRRRGSGRPGRRSSRAGRWRSPTSSSTGDSTSTRTSFPPPIRVRRPSSTPSSFSSSPVAARDPGAWTGRGRAEPIHNR